MHRRIRKCHSERDKFFVDVLDNFLTRQQVRDRTGWSLRFIDRHLPRVTVGRKVLIPVDALNRLLSGGQTHGR